MIGTRRWWTGALDMMSTCLTVTSGTLSNHNIWLANLRFLILKTSNAVFEHKKLTCSMIQCPWTSVEIYGHGTETQQSTRNGFIIPRIVKYMYLYQDIHITCTLPETNIAPVNEWSEDELQTSSDHAQIWISIHHQQVSVFGICVLILLYAVAAQFCLLPLRGCAVLARLQPMTAYSARIGYHWGCQHLGWIGLRISLEQVCLMAHSQSVCFGA